MKIEVYFYAIVFIKYAAGLLAIIFCGNSCFDFVCFIFRYKILTQCWLFEMYTTYSLHCCVNNTTSPPP